MGLGVCGRLTYTDIYWKGSEISILARLGFMGQFLVKDGADDGLNVSQNR